MADELLDLVRQILRESEAGVYPDVQLPAGFAPPPESLLPLERRGGASFGYFDAAVTADGLRVIEVQAFPTYHVTAAFCSHFLRSRLSLPGNSVFVNEPESGWRRFVDLTRDVTAGGMSDGIVLTDRNLVHQKTTFEFNATQRELDLSVDVVDSRRIFEAEGRLMYRRRAGSSPKPLHRLYNRVLVIEALEDDHYPRNPRRWRFRYDRAYPDFAFVNHPARSLELSKGILPYLSHPLNPTCHELQAIAEGFRRREIGFGDFVWKHKWGAAGRGVFLLPSAEILDVLTRAGTLGEYVAQRKIEYERFRTGDGQEKIVELRLMTVQSAEELLVVPMARIGHVQTAADGRTVHRIHFGDNNRPGYGFCPVLILDP